MGIGWNPAKWPGYAVDYAQGRRKGGITGSNPKEFLEGTDRDKAGSLGKIGDEADRASAWATRGQVGFDTLGTEATAERDYMRRIARGQESVSAEQLRQAMQQSQAQQQSMAAGARPGNAAMAARQAAMNASRQGAGLAGQQAIAGIQERQQAQNSLQQMLMAQRQQELSATLGSRGQALQGYGTQYTGQMGQPTGMEKAMDYAKTGASIYAMSDKRIKHNIKDGTEDADAALRKLAAYKYDYDDEKHGKGKQLGLMAQDIEAAGLGHAVEETKEGKAVHGGKMALSVAAMAVALNKRLEKLEGK